jgi:hypothetical protein
MANMQERQQAALEPLASSALDIQKRMRRLQEHMQAFAALGKAAGDASALLQSENGDRAAGLEGAKAQLAKITEDARSLFEAARSDDFPEVAREADALRQRVSALRKRLDEQG